MTKPTKPRQVVIAGRFMWALWALGTALLLFGLIAGATRSQPHLFTRTIMFLIAMSLFALLIRSVLKGLNWARIVYALVVCIGVAFVVVGLMRMSQFTVAGIAAPIALIVVYSAILSLLFHPASTAWFRRGSRSST